MRGIIAFLLFFSLSAQGQFIIDSYRFGAAGLLLDDYPTASAAYSLRLLRTAYTGDAIVVRRSSNNDTLAIGFSGGVLDTAAMKTFCGTGGTDTCFVRRWYDQSGNAIDFTQPTNANQPTIISSGSIFYFAGEVAVDFDGTNDFLDGPVLSNYITNSTYTFFGVASADTITTTTDNNGIYDNANLWGNAGGYIGLNFRRSPNRVNLFNYDNNYDVIAANINLSEDYIFLNRHAGGNIFLALNNNSESSLASGNASFVSSAARIGRNYASLYFNGKIKELIFYKTDQSSNRTAIETNINNFYSIY
jgi:hypothetical protein